MYSDKSYFLSRMSSGELGKLTDSTDANLEVAIADADAMIDSYLRTKISVLPLLPVPNEIRNVSFVIAVYYLHTRRQFNTIPDFVSEQYDNAISYLKDIAAGRVTLTTADSIDDSAKESSVTVTGFETRMRRDFP